MDCNKLKTNTPKATWEGYDILGECHNGSFKKTFLAKKDSLYYMISCVPNIVENKKELGIMSSIKNCEYIIKLVGSFIITPDSLNQLGGSQLCRQSSKLKDDEIDDLLDSRSGSNGEQARIPITPRLRRLSTQVQPVQPSQRSSALSRQSLPS